MFDQAGERVAFLTVDVPSCAKPIRYVSDDVSPLILDTPLAQAHHAAMIAAGCDTKVRQFVRN